MMDERHKPVVMQIKCSRNEEVRCRVGVNEKASEWVDRKRF